MTAERLVTVLSTSDVTMVALVKSFLDGEGIRYIVKGEGTQGLLAPSALWGQSSLTVVTIQVLEQDSGVVFDFLKKMQKADGEGKTK